MKQNRLLLLFAAASLVLAFPLQAAKRTVTILHVSDTHSHLDGVGPRDASLKPTVGGLAKATTLLNELRATETNVVLLHGGDIFQGDVFFNFTGGVPELSWLHRMQFDAVVLGNHDLDFGPAYLGQVAGPALDETPVPFVAANVPNPGTYGLGTLVKPAIVKLFGELPQEDDVVTDGVMVGVFGLTVPDDPLLQSPAGMLDTHLVDIAKQQVAALASQGAEVIVLLSHLGLSQDEMLGQMVEGIDLIISGHSHITLDKPIEVSASGGRRKCAIVASSPFYGNIGRTRLSLDRGAARVESYDLLPLDANVAPDLDVEAQVEAMRAEIENFYGPIFSTRVGETTGALAVRARSGSVFLDSQAGNFVADALRFAGRTDVGLTTSGLVSEGLAAGPIVPVDLFRVVSYGFDETTGLGWRVVTASITGSELLKALETGLLGQPPEDPFFPAVSGISLTYLPSGGNILKQQVKVGGEPLDLNRTYTLTTNEAVAMFCPLLGIELMDVTPLAGVFEFNALMNYVQELGGIVEPPALGRVRALRERRAPVIPEY